MLLILSLRDRFVGPRTVRAAAGRSRFGALQRLRSRPFVALARCLRAYLGLAPPFGLLPKSPRPLEGVVIGAFVHEESIEPSSL